MPPLLRGGRLSHPLLAMVLLAAARPSASQNTDNCRFSVDGANYDLCPLVGRDFKMCKPGGFEGVESCYIAGVGKKVDSPCAGVDAMVLETMSTGLGMGCRVLGSMHSSSVVPLPGGDGVAMLYTGGDACGTGQKWGASIQFVCSPSAQAVTAGAAKGGASLMSVQASPFDRCTYDFVVASEHGCPTGHSLGGLLFEETEQAVGHSSRALFVLLVFAAAYLGVGIYYKSTVLGHTTFPDFIPHVGFWKSYPSLVKDGTVWTIESALAVFGGGGGPFMSGGSRAEQEQLHSNRANMHRDTFANFVPHRIGASAQADAQNLL